MTCTCLFFTGNKLCCCKQQGETRGRIKRNLTLATWKCSARRVSSIPDESSLCGELPRAVARSPISTPRKLNLRIFWLTLSIADAALFHPWYDMSDIGCCSCDCFSCRQCSVNFNTVIAVTLANSTGTSVQYESNPGLPTMSRRVTDWLLAWLQQTKAQLLLLLLLLLRSRQRASPPTHGTVPTVTLCCYTRLCSFPQCRCYGEYRNGTAARQVLLRW